MKDRDFVNAIYFELFKENFAYYKERLALPSNENDDPYNLARKAMASLSESQKMDIINFLKVVITDSVSVLLGTIDGVHFPDELDGDFVLSVGGEEIQGDLQDIFIGKTQDDETQE
ncbi:hypothetical protein ACI2KE_15675 [Pseudomonas monteilii]